MKELKNLKIIVGVSGGPDSMFLLNKIYTEKSFSDLIVCHVNYHLREESNYDQNVVEKYCKARKIKLEVLDAKYLTGNIEEWARNIRYEFFKNILEKNKFDLVCVAHNQNDLIETYLMQKDRKNIVSYYGIKKEQYLNEVKIFRPILEYKKSYIENFLIKNGIEYAIDKSNYDTKYLRNKIRKHLNEENFENILSEINKENNFINEFYFSYTKSFQNKSFEKNILEKMNDFDKQRFLFEWLKFNGFGNVIVKRKKKLLKELLKQIDSPKNISFKTNDFTIEKIKDIIFII